MPARTATAFILTLTIASHAAAHNGPRIWVDQLDGRVVTLTSDNDFAPSAYTPARLFAAQFGYDSINSLTTEFPGFEAPRGTAHHLADGTVIGFNIAGPAWVFDNADGVFETTADHFGDGTAPQLGIGIGFSDTRATADGPVAGDASFLTFSSTGGGSDQNHRHLEFAMLGNGVSPSTGPSGVYALPLELTSTGLSTSEVFYLLLGTAGTDTAPGSPLFEQAMNAAAIQFIARPGDSDGDGDVDNTDLQTAIANFTGPQTIPPTYTKTGAEGDADGDGAVSNSDLQAAISNFTGPSTTPVPEPGTLGLAVLVPLAMRRRA